MSNFASPSLHLRSAAMSRGVFALVAVAAGVAAFAVPAAVSAQYPPLTTPQPSPHARVEQTVGVTTISVDYSRPRVNGREVWGGLVPWGQVWRAGANVNTIVEFSTPVAVAGHALPAGRYGLHTIPTEKEWTVIFSRDADQWGSFSYDASRDALRFPLTPSAAPMIEALEYTIEPSSAEAAEIVLHWEKLALAIPVAIDTKAETVAALRRDLTGLPQFFWQPWNQAANYLLANDLDPAQAAAWARKSIEINENFTNSRTMAKILRKQGDAAAAAALEAKNLGAATEAELNQYGYEQLGAGDRAGAIATFRKNVKDHPQSWNCYDSLGEALLADPKTKAEGVAMYRKALGMAPANQKARIEGILAANGG